MKIGITCYPTYGGSGAVATELGISPGTVKIHLKHIFEKTGIHGRHGLALTVLRQKGVLPGPAA